jgi:hypothetical protein
MGSYQVSGYLGLEFQIKGQTHYGSALVSIAAVFNGRTGSMEMDLPPKVRQLVKTQNPMNGG